VFKKSFLGIRCGFASADVSLIQLEPVFMKSIVIENSCTASVAVLSSDDAEKRLRPE
jgi:hypothetical protein